jgi:hypothetical protein
MEGTFKVPSKNNRNYDKARTKLPEEVPTHPIYRDNPFFWSIPMQDNNMRVLEYQQRFVDKLLSYSLDYPNVLYCMEVYILRRIY